jgi:magnesium transporter
MLRVLRAGQSCIEIAPAELGEWRPATDAVWIELVDPTKDEEHRIENSLGLLLPTREEMAEIEASSRLYQDNGATFMTATVLVNSLSDTPENAPITFVLTGNTLVTIRYAEPKSFALFNAHCERQNATFDSGADVMLGLLEAVVDRTADILEHLAADEETISGLIFLESRTRRFRPILNRLGRVQALNALARVSLTSLNRLVSFAALAKAVDTDKDAKGRLKTLGRDIASIIDHSSHLSANTTFLLDATLGQINIEQNDIIKIFSVAAVAFLPPTLIASIYGMNFHHMPELDLTFGYPTAIAGMVLSAIVPLWWFRRKGWL